MVKFHKYYGLLPFWNLIPHEIEPKLLKIAVGSAVTEHSVTAEGGEISTYCLRQYLLPMAVADPSAEGHILLEHWLL